METHLRTLQEVFNQPQRLLVPLFQRQYVWNRDEQWAPLWADVAIAAERIIANPTAKQQPHFLGAVVLQQMTTALGLMQMRTVIDGQQRLTTLQLLLDALEGEVSTVGENMGSQRLDALVTNPDAFCRQPEDRFKVWPTNRDRPGFNAVMGAPTPVEYSALDHSGERLVEAHRFFAEAARAWLAADGDAATRQRAAAVEQAARELLHLVVIDLAPDEDAQEIFETLNARGTPLTAADLIKNLVFQRLTEQSADTEVIYEQSWQDFETDFWQTKVGRGDRAQPRLSLFLDHWLVARTGEDIAMRNVFGRFKRYVDHEHPSSMVDLVAEIDRCADTYRTFVDGATANNPIDRQQLFSYRLDTMRYEVFKPVVLWLLDPEQDVVPGEQLIKALESLESWLVRRMLVHASTRGYNQIAVELIERLHNTPRDKAGDTVEHFLAEQQADRGYWPDDTEVTAELSKLVAYKRLSRGSLRMVLEAIEDHRRGFIGTTDGLGGERVARGKSHIEHILPQNWQAHWPLGSKTAEERDRLLHSIGNLTLLTGKLNSTVSNAAWTLKRDALHAHDVMKLNLALLDAAGDAWDEDLIQRRTALLIGDILTIWPAPQLRSAHPPVHDI